MSLVTSRRSPILARRHRHVACLAVLCSAFANADAHAQQVLMLDQALRAAQNRSRQLVAQDGGCGAFIALAGVSAEFGVIMLLYLKQAWDARIAAGPVSTEDLLDAIRESAVLRVRSKAMTVAVILAGLLPLLWGTGTGSDVMQRIAAPMVGGMNTAPLLSMFLIPAVYLLMPRQRSNI